MKPILFVLFICLALPGWNQREIDSLKTLIQNTKDPGDRLSNTATLLLKMYTSGNREFPVLFEKFTKEAQTSGSAKGLGAMYNLQGILFYYTSQFDSAIVYFDKAIRLRRQADDKEGLLKTTSNVGGIYVMLGDYNKALKYYEEALQMESALGFKEGEKVALTNLGAVYLNLRIVSKAKHYYLKAAKLVEEKGSSGDASYAYDGLADVYRTSRQMDSAIYFAEKSVAIARRMDSKNSLGYALTKLAMIQNTKQEYNLAAKSLHEALALTFNPDDKRLRIAVLGNLAAAYVQQDMLDSAMHYFERFMPLQEELKFKRNEEDLSKLYAEYYYRKGDFQKAYDYLKMFSGITDSLYQIDATNKITEMQEKFETKQKEKENQLLQTENRSIRSTRNLLVVIVAIALLALIGGVYAFRRIRLANLTILTQKEMVELKQKEILDSINYARRIQLALLGSGQLLRSALKQHFVLFRPKDVVSGDFYWGASTSEGFMLVTGDCTGHGVPGAFMSLLNISKLSQIVNEQRVHRPDMVLNQLRGEIIRALNPEGVAEESRDGMDAVVCCFDFNQMKLSYAAANNSFYIVRKGELLTCKADKMPVGKGHDDSVPFSYSELALEPGDMVYTLTDGFADQFGGIAGKKFKYKQLEKLFLNISQEDVRTQETKLSSAFDQWKGKLDQVDDVCIVGVRV